ncbi:MAG: RNA-binding protein [Lachnospiraceae bacterium]|nr:RNA-binding protein [Lachnospiraceae bacterium]
MKKEEQLLIKRFHDLANTAYRRGITTYSDFLNINEISSLHAIEKDLSFVKIVLDGGYSQAERQIAAFVPDAFLPITKDFPLSILKIEPANAKFADRLNHRDYLGAILNLGIDRCKIGDILVKEESAFLFAHSSMEDFLCGELTRIKHTTVKIVPCEEPEEIVPSLAHIEGSISSERVDAVLSLAFRASRSSISQLVPAEKVYINGKLCCSNSQTLKSRDVVSVRGYGKFIYQGVLSTTKKGRLFVALDKYT